MMTTREARIFLQRVFDEFGNPHSEAEVLGQFFAPDYIQNADENILDYSTFIDHARTLKKTLAACTVTFEKVIADGSTIASIHIVDARKKTGERVRMKVIAFFEIENGRIKRVDEMTHLLEGEAADRDLGSRTS